MLVYIRLVLVNIANQQQLSDHPVDISNPPSRFDNSQLARLNLQPSAVDEAKPISQSNTPNQLTRKSPDQTDSDDSNAVQLN